MSRIEKGVQSKYFKAILDGRKRYEVRLGDFAYEPGDILVLREEEEGTKNLTGREIECEILLSFNTKDAEQFWPKEEIDKHGLVVLSLQRKYDHGKLVDE